MGFDILRLRGILHLLSRVLMLREVAGREGLLLSERVLELSGMQ